MNIFYLHKDTRKCAEYHNDKHTVKMILEYAQLLSTAHRVLDGTPTVVVTPTTGRKRIHYLLSDSNNDLFYSATHINHPSAIWVRQSIKNYMWLAEMLESLCGEYTYRYGKIHKVESSGLMQALKNNFPKNLADKDFTEPTPAMPDECKVSGNSIASYRNYYIMNKTHLADWKNRSKPDWYPT